MDTAQGPEARTGAAAWTGGQFSAWRVLFGLFLMIHVASQVRAHALCFLSLAIPVGLAAALVAIGLFVKPAAAVLLALLPLTRSHGEFPGPGLVTTGLLLVLLLCIPASPYGSLAARSRIDPGGGWRMPRLVYISVWIALALIHAVPLVTERWPGLQSSVGGLTGSLLSSWIGWSALVLVPLALHPRLRPFVWCALLALQLVNRHPIWAFPGTLLLLLAFDPSWVAPRKGTDEIVFYDGSCGLCHGLIRFILAEDTSGALRFGALQGETFAALVPEETRRALPDSVVVRREDGELLMKSRAALHVGHRLGGLWRGIALVVGVLPTKLLDSLYDEVASVRYRVFGKKMDACPILPLELRKRFAA